MVEWLSGAALPQWTAAEAEAFVAGRKRGGEAWRGAGSASGKRAFLEEAMASQPRAAGPLRCG